QRDRHRALLAPVPSMVPAVSPEQAAELRTRAEARDAIISLPANRLDEIAREVRELHEKVLQHALPRAIRIGELLIEAKRTAGRGRWISWVKTHCGFGEREAQRYMRVAKNKSLVIDATPVSHSGVKAASKALAKPRLRSPGIIESLPESHEAIID